MSDNPPEGTPPQPDGTGADTPAPAKKAAPRKRTPATADGDTPPPAARKRAPAKAAASADTAAAAPARKRAPAKAKAAEQTPAAAPVTAAVPAAGDEPAPAAATEPVTAPAAAERAGAEPVAATPVAAGTASSTVVDTEPAAVDSPESAADEPAPASPASAAGGEPVVGAWAEPDAPAAEPVAATPVAAAPVAAAPVPAQPYPGDMARFSPLPPPPPGFLQTRWQGPDYAGGPAAWTAALIGGLATALALPLSRPGLGWLLVGLVMTGAVWHASRFGPKPDTAPERWIRVGWAVLAMALLAVGTFRDSGQLFTMCVLGALACASLAVAGGHSVRAVIVGASAVPLAAFRAIPWLAKGAGAWRKTRAKRGTAGRIVVSLLVTVVLLVIFGALFASADPAFGKLLGDLIPEVDMRSVFRVLLYTLVGGLITAGAIFTVLAPPDLSGLERPSSRRIGRIEVALPLGGLVLLFAAFVVVQLRFFFGDTAYIQKTSGLTFSAYAVQGFYQLLAVTLLTLVVIGAVSRWAAKDTVQDRVLLRALLGGLVLLSMVIVGSAVWRMWLYQNTYGWTRERVFFGSVELYLGGVFILIALAGWKLRASWFPRAAVAGFAGLLLFLGAANFEHFIAEQNAERMSKAKLDFWYVRALSSDAAPVLADLPEPYRSCALSWIDADLRDRPENWYSWNLSRAQAAELIREIRLLPADKACTDADRLYSSRR